MGDDTADNEQLNLKVLGQDGQVVQVHKNQLQWGSEY